MKHSEGDKVKVKTKDKEYEGILMPERDKNLVLKLDNGYNVGIDKKKVKKITLVKKSKKTKKKKPKVKQNKDLPLISILHTGGTIASRVDYKTGGVVAQFTPEELISNFPELREIAQLRCNLVSNLQSESMRFGHYNLMAKSVKKELKKKPKGIIITHGTDTIHYSAAALSFMLENIDIPVLLVGSQRSSDRGSTDAAVNLVCAAKFIANTDFKGVAICMHKSIEDKTCSILPATKSRKMHTSRRDAFKPINDSGIAEVNYFDDKIKWKNKEKYEAKGTLDVKLFKDNLKVGLLKTHTNMFPEDILHFEDYDGLVVEGTGLGHMQTTGFDDISKINEDNKNALASIIKKGCVVVLTSQCIFGRVNMNVYSPQRELLDVGVIPGKDMHAETAFIKLGWLLSNYEKKEVKGMIGENLRGEINNRLSEEHYLEDAD